MSLLSVPHFGPVHTAHIIRRRVSHQNAKTNLKRSASNTSPVWEEEASIEYIDPKIRSAAGVLSFMSASEYSKGELPSSDVVVHGTHERINQIAFKYWKQKGSSMWGYTSKYQHNPPSTTINFIKQFLQDRLEHTGMSWCDYFEEAH